MMIDTVLYQEGTVDSDVYTFEFDFGAAGLSGTRAAGVTRYIEFWCQENCRGHWRIAERCNTLSLSFERGLDVVLFKLSDDYNRFATSNSVIRSPTYIA